MSLLEAQFGRDDALMINGLATKLRSIIRARPPRLILIISRPVTPSEIQFYSMIFDDVVIERPIQMDRHNDPTEPLPTNVLWATRIPYSVGPEEISCEVGYAIRIVGRQSDSITFHQRGCSPAKLLLARGTDTIADYSPLERGNATQATSMGVTLTKDFENKSLRPSGAEFILIEEGDELQRYVAELARAGLYDRILGGLTGLES
ncbi:hypothetical protein [Bradyrhizobium liaoningense]|uniref:hypothetical protein n=1 Tax=Bradyrhizobium liaoningense TaxID=43992 RepID=UPI001BA6031B|nr:hypothetical protein [Bradyrhizobium liaoningense]MBR0859202.1 hypothetical protein [Bradyrhizobium liaoningense]